MKPSDVRSESLKNRLEYLIPGVVKSGVPRWPPDAFCICAALLQASGAYSAIVDDDPPQGPKAARSKRVAELKRVGLAWRKAATTTRPLPAKVIEWWKIITKHQSVNINQIRSCSTCTLALLNILAAADEASEGIGLYFHSNEGSDPFGKRAERILFFTAQSDEGATLCMNVSPSKGRVLPKMHTPQNGLTIRSLSHHLAYVYSPDIQPEWLSTATDDTNHCFNLLVVPWPFEVQPKQFQATQKYGVAASLDSHAYGLFTYKPSRGPSIEFVRSLLAEAQAKLGRVDGIVFPELSMSKSEFHHLSQEFVTDKCFLIAGVGLPAKPSTCGTNEALWEVGSNLGPDLKMKTLFAQKKHHRWKLTKPQILQYGLAGNLHPEADYWEHIAVGKRTLSFVTFRPWLTMSVLICEDLARPDPVGDVLRAVGPNLIIALLCDGPQLMSRWPGRYAGALADDPGTSVLTLTSLGASKLSKRLGGGVSQPRNVALWRDAKSGATEIELPEGASALLLNLTVEYHEEWTADGRGDEGAGGYPVLSGVHPIYVREGKGNL